MNTQITEVEASTADTSKVMKFNGVDQERRILTEIPGLNSQALQARRELAVSPAVPSVLPAYVAKAGGGIIVDIDGNHFIDFASGIGVVGVGNSAPRVVEAVTEQVAAFTHTAFAVAPYEGYVEVCERLNRQTPGDHAKTTALFNSGAEAVENAVKVARHATGRSAIVVLEHGYHGRTNLTLAMTSKASPFKTGFGPFAPDIYRIPASYPLRDRRTGEEAFAVAKSAIEAQIGADQVAAIIFEPIIGEGGFIVPAEGFLPALCDYAREHGILTIADEIQSGFARTGAWFASEHEGIVPDMVTTAKGLGGGLPISALTARTEIMMAIQPGGLGGTYAGNPVACAASLAAFDTIEQDGLLAAATQIGKIAGEVFAEAAAQPGSPIAEIRGRGAMIAIEIVKPGTLEPDPELTARVAKRCHRDGVLVLVTGTYGNAIRLLPPLVTPERLIKDGLAVLTDAIEIESGTEK